jgi:hypothetical protein
MNHQHGYSLDLHDDSDLTIDAEPHSRTPGGWVRLGPIAIHADDMAALADTMERASRLARSVAADQQYEQGGVES